ncbi:MAG TPA: hypothetical protein VIK63_05750 [Haloplasmataceae bacterium]
MKANDPKHKRRNNPYHDFEYDPTKGIEIPNLPYDEEIAEETEAVQDEENDEQKKRDPNQPFVDLVDSEVLE